LLVSDPDENDLYNAMDWLLERQSRIENKIASRHLEENGLALYDLTSSYFEGRTCPLAAMGHNRYLKKGKLQVNYGLLTNRKGIPVAVSVFEGNTGDPKTLMPQVEKMQDAFGIEQFVMVGDRGMLTQKQIDAFHDIDGIDWIGALRPEAVNKLATSGAIQMGLFDERNLFETKHPDFPGERLIACRNAELAHRRAVKRESLLQATVKELDKVRGMVRRGWLSEKNELDARVSGILKKYRIGKHFEFDIREDGFNYKVNEGALIAEVTVKSKRLDDGSRAHSFRSLLGHLAAIVRATCRCSGERNTSATFTMITRHNPKQQKAFDLLKVIRV